MELLRVVEQKKMENWRGPESSLEIALVAFTVVVVVVVGLSRFWPSHLVTSLSAASISIALFGSLYQILVGFLLG